jgi:hypothetical protein
MKADAAKKAGLVDEVSTALLASPWSPAHGARPAAAAQIVESEKDLVKRAGVIALEIAAGARRPLSAALPPPPTPPRRRPLTRRAPCRQASARPLALQVRQDRSTSRAAPRLFASRHPLSPPPRRSSGRACRSSPPRASSLRRTPRCAVRSAASLHAAAAPSLTAAVLQRCRSPSASSTRWRQACASAPRRALRRSACPLATVAFAFSPRAPQEIEVMVNLAMHTVAQCVPPPPRGAVARTC